MLVKKGTSIKWTFENKLKLANDLKEGAHMSLFDEKALDRYNKKKLQEMQKGLEALRQNADSCEIKLPIINNGYHVCPCAVDCNR